MNNQTIAGNHYQRHSNNDRRLLLIVKELEIDNYMEN